MLNRYTLPLISALVVSVSLASCQRKEVVSVPELPPAGEIGFTVSDSDAETKSTPLETNYFGTNHSSFKVVVYSHAEGATTSDWALYSDTLTCSYNLSYGIWKPRTAIDWPMTEDKLTFIACAPTSLSPTNSSGGSLADGQVPYLRNFTVDSDVNDQKDILLASKESSASPLVQDLNVGLEFHHALTFVKFSIGVGTTCSSITLSGISGTGTLDMSTGAWSSLGTADASYTINPPAFGSWDANGQRLIDEAYTLMLIPQTLPAGATLTADTSAGTITASLAGQVWEPGRVVTYKITDPASFTVSSTGDKVRFSPGNLQYTKSTGIWSFMAHQYSTVEYTGQDVGTDYANQDVVSLFGWGTSGHVFPAGTYGSAFQPWSTSTTDTEYGPKGDYGLTGEYADGDWGSAVASTLGSGWRTLSSDEWEYLLNTRGGEGYPRYCKATVNDVPGLVIFPDGYSHPSGVTDPVPASVNTPGADFISNQWSVADWDAMESVGCVFLPAAGYRSGYRPLKVREWGCYWSSTYAESDPGALDGILAYDLWFKSDDLTTSNYGYGTSRHYGDSVRLVKDL